MNSAANMSQSKQVPNVAQSKLKIATPAESAVSISGRLQPHQDELQQLSELAGVHMDVQVFRILVELLNMGVDPTAIFVVLKSIRRSPLKHGRKTASQVPRKS